MYHLNFRLINTGDVVIHSEHHEPHEIVMDWSWVWTMKVAPTVKLPLRMRSHILVEPPKSAGGVEKVFKIFEEWNGNKQLNEKSAPIPMLGRLHQRLRQFHGFCGAAVMKYFFQ